MAFPNSEREREMYMLAQFTLDALAYVFDRRVLEEIVQGFVIKIT